MRHAPVLLVIAVVSGVNGMEALVSDGSASFCLVACASSVYLSFLLSVVGKMVPHGAVD